MRLHAVVAVLAFLALASWGFAAEKKTDGKAPADAPATPPAPANEWHGTVGCAKCDFVDRSGAEECLPAIKTADACYLLKAAPTAPPAIKEFLTRIQNKEMAGAYLVHGDLAEADGKKWIAVTSMVAKPLPVASATLTLNRKKSTTGGGEGGADQGGGGGDQGGGGGGGGRGRRKHSHAEEGGEGQ